MLAGLGSTLIPGLEELSKKRKETKKEGEKEKVNETYISIANRPSLKFGIFG